MAEYRIEFAPSAHRPFAKLDPQVQRRLAPHISALAIDPHPAESKALVGLEGLRRIRVGSYRIVYRVEDDCLVVLVLKLGHRRDIYRGH